MLRRLVALALVPALLVVGCLGAVQESGAPDAALPAGNVWERGLATQYETPPVAVARSAEDRRANVAPPGDPEFAAFDRAMESWMARYGIPSGQISLMHEGKLRYESGYGSVDEAGTTPTDALTMYRVASVSKPMAGAVVALQIEQGLYEWDDPVFCIRPDPAPDCRLTIEPHPAHPFKDERLREITVAQLLDHTAGWGRPADRNLWGDGHVELAQALGIPSPTPAWRVAQYMLGEELAYDPGTNDEYCNMCYLMLGLVAESATGVAMSELFEAYLFRPLEVSGDVEPGQTPLELRNPREPFYVCDGEMGSVYEPGERGCASEVGFDLQTIMTVGGMISTTAAAVSIYEVYETVFTDPIGPPGSPFMTNGHGGSLPGTATFVETIEGTAIGEVQYAAFFNSRAAGDPVPVLSVYNLQDALRLAVVAWAASEGARGVAD